jgi:hypothetical protein
MCNKTAYILTLSLLARTDSIHATSADQDQPAHPCRPNMTRTVCNSFRTYFEKKKKISIKLMNGLAKIEKWTSPLLIFSGVSLK